MRTRARDIVALVLSVAALTVSMVVAAALGSRAPGEGVRLAAAPGLAGTYTCQKTIAVDDTGVVRESETCTPAASPTPSATASSTPSSSPSSTPPVTTTPPPTTTPAPSPTPTASTPDPTTPGPTLDPTPSATSTVGPTTTPPATTSPPSPTPTGPQLACLASPHLCGFPDASNTGPRPGQAITTTINGNITVTTPGQVIANTRINGCLSVKAVNVTIRDSIIACGGNYAILNSFSGKDFGGLVVEDTELDGLGSGFTGFGFGDSVISRVNIHGFENGFYFGTQVTVTDSYVHDLRCCGSSLQPLHPDVAQMNDDSSDMVFEHNTLIAPITNSVFAICCTSGGTVHDFTADNNLVAGGGWTIYCPRYASTNIDILNNRFGPANFGPASSCTGDHATWAGNVSDATGQPVPAG